MPRVAQSTQSTGPQRDQSQTKPATKEVRREQLWQNSVSQSLEVKKFFFPQVMEWKKDI